MERGPVGGSTYTPVGPTRNFEQDVNVNRGKKVSADHTSPNEEVIAGRTLDGLPN